MGFGGLTYYDSGIMQGKPSPPPEDTVLRNLKHASSFLHTARDDAKEAWPEMAERISAVLSLSQELRTEAETILEEKRRLHRLRTAPGAVRPRTTP